MTMTLADLIDLKERIALNESFSAAERDFLLELINRAAPSVTVAFNPPSYLHRIDSIWAFLSVDSGGEGVVAAPIGPNKMTVPLIAADQTRLESLIPLVRDFAKLFGKTIRLARYTSREDVEIFEPQSRYSTPTPPKGMFD